LTARCRSEEGTLTLWFLGLCLLLFALGGLSLDLWRGFSTRRALRAAADSAALAGASAIDEDLYRSSGEVRLDPAEAEARARADVARQLDRSALRDVVVQADPSTVVVVVRGELRFTLLNVVQPSGGFPVRVTAAATPRRTT
jgi:Flp pilus assembly protein TadG